MIEKGRISALQMAILLHLAVIATGILLVPSVTGKVAKQDMWLSPIWASSAGFLVLFLALSLHKRYPKQTVIEYSEKILGVIPGKVVGFLFLFFYLHLNGLILREYAEFVVGNFLIQTPLVVVVGGMVFVCMYAVRGGLEVIARAAQLFIPVVFSLFLLVFLLLMPDLDPTHMFPVMEHGIMPSLKGAVVPFSWFSEFFLIAFILPYIGGKEKVEKWGVFSVVSVMTIMLMTNFFSLFLFGNITAKFIYPVMSAARYISIADFLEHLEAVIMAIWVAGTFVKISVFYYVIVLGTAQWLKLSDYRPLVFPMGLILVTVSYWSAANVEEIATFISTAGPFYLFTIQILLPAFLLMVEMIRKRKVGK